MNIHELNYVLCIAKHQNMTKAAQELFISQPTLSKHLGKLELQQTRLRRPLLLGIAVLVPQLPGTAGSRQDVGLVARTHRIALPHAERTATAACAVRLPEKHRLGLQRLLPGFPRL